MVSHPEIIAKFYDFLLVLLPKVAKFPRSDRYQLGERLESSAFDALEILLAASLSREKSVLLGKANIKLEQARHYVRLSKDLRLVDIHGYEVISKLLNDIGLQLGGWIKQQKQKQKRRGQVLTFDF